ncbi:hypothetical protein [Rickettsia hoogstraalii]|uniref:hypothetical protein n=2 Tax=Rickettsia hoogstraalii TaxID=467174 RepID=UPI00058B5898|nr:hypothetical protein [Rickettsia hoogstraalii]
MFKWKVPQEVAAIKTPHERLIEFLEKRGLQKQADSLRKGGTTLDLRFNQIGAEGAKLIADSLKSNSTLTNIYLSSKKIGAEGLETIKKYLQRNKTIAKKAESLNAEGNNLCSQEKYNEAIEKYKAAIKIMQSLYKENKLYETNKTNAEKKYEAQQQQELEKRRVEEEKRKLLEEQEKKKQEEQQQSLKLKQEASIINENKPADIKDLPEENIKEKLATFQNIVVEAVSKLENSTTINEQDKAVLQDRINEISRTVKTFINNADINTMIKAVEELARGKITKARIAVVEEDLSEIIEQQIKLAEQIRTEKLTIFQNVVENMTTKIESSTTINARDKDIMQNSIKGIVIKVQRLANKTDIETITKSIEELISGKLTKAKLGVVEEDVDLLIEQQNKPNHDVTVNKVEEIIYDKPLLNHPKLLQTTLDSKVN